jgi:hypothetical protein
MEWKREKEQEEAEAEKDPDEIRMKLMSPCLDARRQQQQKFRTNQQ